MRVHSLDPANPSALRTALVRHGVPPVRADAVVSGSAGAGLLVTGLGSGEREALQIEAQANQVDCLAGDDWVILVGTLAHLAGLTRPGHSRLDSALSDALGIPLRGLTDPRLEWQTGRGPVDLTRPVIAGIVNVTPDSFSDGGQYLDPDAATARAVELAGQGADLIDVGAASTRPGAEPVTAKAEWDRLRPALAAIVRELPAITISVDTCSSEIARRAVGAGASVINDVSGLRLDPDVARVCAESGAGLILMHSRGDVTTMASYQHADYEDVVFDVVTELRDSVLVAERAGVNREAIVVDPGLGFGKRPEQNRQILGRLSDFAALGFPVMVGPSRKRFLRDLIEDSDLGALDRATAVLCAGCWHGGARLFRVHRADHARRALDLVSAVWET